MVWRISNEVPRLGPFGLGKLGGFVGGIQGGLDRALEAEIVKRLDFVRGSAKTGAVQKMCRLSKVPLKAWSESQHSYNNKTPPSKIVTLNNKKRPWSF